MRKTLILILTFFMAVVLVSTSAYALTGACSNCHTMHNSQDGKGVVTLYDIGTPGALQTNQDEPQPQLLKASCIACHMGDAGETGKTNVANNAPIVFHLTCPSGQGGNSTLAGGDFCFVAKGVGTPDDSKGHNIAGISDQDNNIKSYTPPGWDKDATPGALDDGKVTGDPGVWNTQLTCDGVFGCHGAHTASGITGAHHSNDGLTATRALNPTNIGNSYRFLSGIKGLENVDWNFNEASDTHNEYYGVDSPAERKWTASGAGTYANKDTISYSCAECHGFFHSKIDDTIAGVKPWLRHPTDIMLPGAQVPPVEYQYYNPDHSNVYSVEAPVARPTVPSGSSSSVTPGTDAIVMCLSCHRAHGSPEPDILRWTYDMQAGVGDNDTGCFTCHVNKNHDQGNN